MARLHAVTLEEALAASGTGDVEQGAAADLVVLDVEELGSLTPAELAAVPVHATMVAGRFVQGPWVEG